MSQPSMLPLEGLRVADFSGRLAGAYCTKLLVDAGADVLKVEPPEGDPLRRWSASRSTGRDGDPDGTLFRYLCSSKRSVVVDLETASGAQRARDIAAEADIVVETWSPGGAERRGLGAEDLLAVNPALVVVSISAFGRGGPLSAEDPPEFILQALSGSSYDHGYPDREPLAVPALLGEWGAGAFAAAAAIAARLDVVRTGQGEHVDVSILEALALTHVTAPVLTASLRGTRTVRESRLPVPGNEPCGDGWVGFFTATAMQWQAFATMTGDERLIGDETLTNAMARMARTNELQPIVRQWTMQHNSAELIELAEHFRVPAAPVGDGSTIPQFDHIKERGLYVSNPRGGFRQPRSAIRWGDHTERALSPAPLLGDVATDQQAPWFPARAVEETAPVHVETQLPRRSSDDGGPLDGVRVLDLTAFWAGPFGTEVLVSMGADVIKIESVQRPDGMRFGSFAPITDPTWYEQGFIFNAVNLGKRDVTIDLGVPAGRDLFLRLVATADVVIENFTPRVLDNFDLGYEVLVAARPDVILVRTPAFGLDGPWRNRPGFAINMDQVSGMAWITGYEGGEPLFANGPFDPIAGTHAAFAVLSALDHRRRTGEGQLIELPMLDVALAITSEQVAEYDAYGQLLTRHGNSSPNAVPQGVYPCSEPETWLALSVQNDEQWLSLANLLEHDWPSRAELSTVEGRWESRGELDAALGSWAASRSLGDALAALGDAGVPAAPVVAPSAIDENPQLQARGFWEEIDHPVLGRRVYAGMPFRRIGKPWYPAPSPLLGQDNEVVLGELGLTEGEMDELRASNVIGNRPIGL